MNQKDVDALTIKELRAALKKAGLQSGPITGSTEAVYRAALYKHLVGLNNKTEQVSLPNAALEDFNSVPTSDGEREEAIEFPVDQGPLSPEIVQPKEQFTPIRWNHKLHRYEALYDANGKLISEGDNHAKADCQWVLLIAVIAVCMAIFIAVIFLSRESDPYKSLEDAASQVAKSREKVVVEL